MTLDGNDQAIGVILFVEKGYLSLLEGYALALDVWPEEYSDIKLNYFNSNGDRDLEKLKTQWI